MKFMESTTRWRALIALGMMAMMMQAAGCSEVEISGKNAADVFKDPQTLALVEAACHGDLPKIDALVKQGANVNATGYRDMTPLVWTMECKNYAGIKKLLKLGANPNYKMEGDISAMWASAGSSDPHFLPLMLAHGGNPNIKAASGFETALSKAIEQNRMQNVKLLLEHGADVNEHYAGNDTAATDAAALAKFDIVEMLLRHGYNYNLQDLVNGVDARGVPPGTPVAAARLKVLQMLATKGYRPTPRPKGFVVLPPPPGLSPSSSDSGGGHP
ncbi:MAG: ankyrin repeat domain-containing protein [Metallibacterium sp.]